MEEQLAESESARREVMVLQNQYKLTWIPDHLVKECQNCKCRSPFSKVITIVHLIYDFKECLLTATLGGTVKRELKLSTTHLVLN